MKSNFDVKLLIIKEALNCLKDVSQPKMSIMGCVYSWDNLTNSPKVLLYIREVFYAARELIDIVVRKVRNETSNKTAKDLESFVTNYVNGTYDQYLESPTLLKLDGMKNSDSQAKPSSILLEINVFKYISDILYLFGKL